jgi:hypothetical protein
MKMSGLLIPAAIAASVVIVHRGPYSPNDASRMATVQALVEHGTFAIDKTAFITTFDKVFVNGHFYSDKPPFPSIIGAAIYTPLFHLGLRLSEGRSAAYYLITLFTMKTWLLVALWCFYRALRLTGLDEGPRRWAVGALALGSLMLPWTSVFNNHGLAASFVTIGFCAFLEARDREDGRIPIAAAGIFFGLAAVCDLPTSAIYAAFALRVVATPGLRRHMALFLLPCSITVIPYLLVNYQISGSILPLQINKEFFIYPGSHWIGSGELSGIAANEPGFILAYAWGCLFGNNGFILYNPLLLIAVPMVLTEIWRRRPFWREALAVLGATCVIFLYYVVMTNNEGGGSFSIRWFVPLLPVLLFFLHGFLDRITQFRIVTFTTLAVLSGLIAVIGVATPWSNKSISEVSLLANLKVLANKIGEIF